MHQEDNTLHFLCPFLNKEIHCNVNKLKKKDVYIVIRETGSAERCCSSGLQFIMSIFASSYPVVLQNTCL